MLNITLRNDFHNTEATVRVKSLPATLTRDQYARVMRKLCGMPTCTCGGIRGRQDVEVEHDVLGGGGFTAILTAREALAAHKQEETA